MLCCIAVAQQSSVLIAVGDENGVAVPGATITLRGPAAAQCTTDVAGRCRLSAPAGSYELTASKPGFYEAGLHGFHVGVIDLQQVVLTHTHEVKESVEVTASPTTLDPQQIAATRSLD